MPERRDPFAYIQIRAVPEYEVRMVGILMRSGQKFSAISKTDYLISNRQCEELTRNNIPYTRV